MAQLIDSGWNNWLIISPVHWVHLCGTLEPRLRIRIQHSIHLCGAMERSRPGRKLFDEMKPVVFWHDIGRGEEEGSWRSGSLLSYQRSSRERCAVSPARIPVFTFPSQISDCWSDRSFCHESRQWGDVSVGFSWEINCVRVNVAHHESITPFIPFIWSIRAIGQRGHSRAVHIPWTRCILNFFSFFLSLSLSLSLSRLLLSESVTAGISKISSDFHSQEISGEKERKMFLKNWSRCYNIQQQPMRLIKTETDTNLDIFGIFPSPFLFFFHIFFPCEYIRKVSCWNSWEMEMEKEEERQVADIVSLSLSLSISFFTFPVSIWVGLLLGRFLIEKPNR